MSKIDRENPTIVLYAQLREFITHQGANLFKIYKSFDKDDSGFLEWPEFAKFLKKVRYLPYPVSNFAYA